MVIIQFSHGDWFNPNWVYRWLVDDIRASGQLGGDIIHELDLGGVYGMLDFTKMQPDLSVRILLAIKATIAHVLDAPPANREDRDQDGERMYRESLAELRDLVEKGGS